MSPIITALQREMHALAEREMPMSMFAGPDFVYWWTKERARATAIDDAKARLPRWARWRRIKREGNRAFKKTVPDWKPERESSVGGINREPVSWWKNARGV